LSESKADEPQTLKDEYSRATKTLDAKYEQVSANLDDVVKTCQELHVKEQHQLKILLKIYRIFYETLGEFSMQQMTIILQLMDPNVKPVRANAYTVPSSVEQQLQQSKEIVRLVHIGVLEEFYSSEWSSPTFSIPKKNGRISIRVVNIFTQLNLLLKHNKSHISFSKDSES
jgi:hypothetical protein